MDPQPVQSDVAFLLKENGSIEKLCIPVGSDGKALDLGSTEWHHFLETQLQIDHKAVCDYYSSDDSESEMNFRQPHPQWDLTFVGTPPNDRTISTALGQEGAPIRRMVAMYCYPYLGMHHYKDVLSFNKSAPLFSTSEYWRGDMVLVCFNFDAKRWSFGQIVPPAEIVESIPEALTGLWCPDFKAFQETQLAFAMLTHCRLGNLACGKVLDHNLVQMILEQTVPIRSEDTWDLRSLFHAMRQVDHYDSEQDEYDSELDDEEPLGPLIDSADDPDSEDSADGSDWL